MHHLGGLLGDRLRQDADGRGPARRWRCPTRNRGIVARPPSTARRLRPARRRGRHGRSSADRAEIMGMQPFLWFPQWITRPRPFGAGPEGSADHWRLCGRESNERGRGRRAGDLVSGRQSCHRPPMHADPQRRGAGPPPDAAALHEAALDYLARYAATEAGLRRVLERRVDRWARLARSEACDADAVARQVNEARRVIRDVVIRLVRSRGGERCDLCRKQGAYV